MDEELRKAADDALDRVVNAATTMMSAEGVAHDVALRAHFGALADRWPRVYQLVVERLLETDNDMLEYVDLGPVVTDD